MLLLPLTTGAKAIPVRSKEDAKRGHADGHDGDAGLEFEPQDNPQGVDLFVFCRGGHADPYDCEYDH